MKPISLRFKGIGSYLDEAYIDFEEIAARNPLFLITGKTGSGKTTIFDAIVYALYGEASGSDRKGNLVNSNIEEENINKDSSFIEFKFEAGSKKYGIKRSSRYRKGKDSGIEQSAELYELDDENNFTGTHIESAPTKVTHKVEDILKLKREQFCKIIILPQKESHTLIKGKSNDVKELLSKLVDWDRYQSVIAELKNKQDSMLSTIKEEKSTLKIKFKESNIDVDSSDNEEARQKIQTLIDENANTIAELKKAIKESNSEKQLLEEQKEKAIKINSDIADCESLKKEYEALALKQGEIDSLKEKTKKLVEVKGIRQDIDDCKKAEEEYQTRKKAVLIAQSTLSDAKSRLDDIADKIIAFENSKSSENDGVDYWKTRLSLYQAAKDKYPEIEALKGSVARVESDLKESAILFEKSKTAFNSKEKACKDNEGLSLKLEESTSNYTELNDRYNELAQANKIASDKDAYTREINVKREEHKAKKSLFEEVGKNKNIAKAKNDELHRRYESEMLRKASANLKKGDICPICHTVIEDELSHNDDTIEFITLEQVKASDDEVSGLVEYYTTLLAEVNAIVEKAKELGRKEKECALRLDEYRYTLDEYNRVKKECEKAAKDLKELQSLRQKRSALHQEQEEARAEKDRLEKQIDGLNAKKVIDSAKLDSLIKSLNFKSDFPKSLSDIDRQIKVAEEKVSFYIKRESELNTEKQNCSTAKTVAQTTLASAKEEEQKASDSYNALRKKIDELLREKGLSSFDEYKPYFDEIDKLDEYKESITRFETELDSKKEAYEKKNNSLTVKEKQDITSINAKRVEVDKKIIDDNTKLSGIKSDTEKLKKLLKEFESKSKELEELEAVYKRLTEFYKRMNGDGNASEYKANFQSYVIGDLLDDIINEANSIIEEHMNGRFKIYRIGTKQDYLGLEVLLSNNRKAYSINRVSGGEEFQISIAFALAIMRVVPFRKNGIEIKSMFIDEGFDTLDEDAVKTVIEVLENISTSQLVGVISHKEEVIKTLTNSIRVENDDATGSHVAI